MASTAPQRYLAEFIGTFALLLIGGGAAVFSLGGDAEARVVLVSMALGLVLAGVIYAFGDTSGGHFNPAVTISMAVSGRMPLREVIPYLVAQIVGAAVGMAVVLGIVLGGPASFVDLAHGAALGSQAYSGNGSPGAFSLGAVFLIEVALTFVFVLIIQLVTRAENSARNLAPIAIGAALLVGNLVAIPVDGASMNPVRSFAPALLSLYWSNDGWALSQSWVFWVAPLLGGVLASLVERAFRPK